MELVDVMVLISFTLNIVLIFAVGVLYYSQKTVTKSIMDIIKIINSMKTPDAIIEDVMKKNYPGLFNSDEDGTSGATLKKNPLVG